MANEEAARIAEDWVSLVASLADQGIVPESDVDADHREATRTHRDLVVREMTEDMRWSGN